MLENTQLYILYQLITNHLRDVGKIDNTGRRQRNDGFNGHRRTQFATTAAVISGQLAGRQTQLRAVEVANEDIHVFLQLACCIAGVTGDYVFDDCRTKNHGRVSEIKRTRLMANRSKKVSSEQFFLLKFLFSK